MKIKKKVSILSILIFVSICSPKIWTQCPNSVSLCSQASVDAFPMMYPGCRHIDTLFFDLQHCLGAANDIQNLDSLIQLESIGFLYLQSPSKIDNIEGLLNIKNINYLRLEAQKAWKTPLNIDTIESINYRFPIDTIADIRLLKNLKYIKNSLNFRGNGSLTPTLNFNSSDIFELYIENNYKQNQVKNVLPQNKSSVKLIFNITYSQNLDFELGFSPEIINALTINNGQKLDFSTWKSVKKIDYLNILANQVIDTSHRFMVESIDNLNISYNIGEFKLEDVIPNVKQVNIIGRIGFNSNLKSIKILDNCSLPVYNHYWDKGQEFIGDTVRVDTIRYIEISNNAKLSTCESDYLCRAFKRFGDTLRVHHNMKDCNDELRLKECLSSTIENTEESPIHFFPNPVFDRLTIDGLKKIMPYHICNGLGQIVQTGTVYDNIDMSQLGAGYYIIKLIDGNSSRSSQVMRVVKME